MNATPDCPCGSKKPFSACCGPYITGEAAAPTAEALMRARYTSYATGNIDFIEKSHAPESPHVFDRKSSEKWAKGSSWKGLTVVATKDGGPGDTTGIVHFIAEYSQDGKAYEHEEVATFRKEGADWLFVGGKFSKPETHVNTGPVLGRNDPCHCGSNKKFKKCHGK
ncbi:MAG: YchJ family protein [Elusimicrobiota bacterium]